MTNSLVHRIADCVYHSVSGCMTAQVAYEVDYQRALRGNVDEVGPSAPSTMTVVAQPYETNKPTVL
jgi:hypothetical protein